MNISKKWLSQYIDLDDISIEEIADKITTAGSEVEGLERMSEGTNLVIGKVESCIDHPDSDHLHVCMVNLGEHVVQIVCGAPNVAAGQRVIVAKVGAVLPGGEIKAGMIRGQASNGMICSLLELGVDPHSLSEESKNGIEVLDDNAPIGNENPLAYLGLDDAIMDVGLTPNRNDCLAAWSMAKETGAVLNRKVTLPACEGAANVGAKSNLKVSSTTNKCPLFLGKVINHVTIKESPKWMKELLRAAGMKSINNVVDISNIVMLETGQPLHFYNIDAIPSQEITVKDQITGTYTALDGVEYNIEADDIMITSEGKPIGIAGIMGGNDSKIEDDTRGIIMEAAIFHHVSIRNSSRRLNLGTDASIRYQKGIEPMATFKAMDRAVQLLIEYADAKELEETVQFGDNNYTPIHFCVNLASMNHLLGTNFTEDEVMDVLRRLDFNPTKDGDKIHVCIPSYRTDLALEEDITEEVIRLIGYDRLPSTMPLMEATVGSLNHRQSLRRRFRSTLTSLGYSENQTYTLVSKHHIEEGVLPLANAISLASPMSEDRKYIRSSILPSLLESIAYNQARSIKDLAFFEISNVYGKGLVEERLAVAMCGNLQSSRWQKIAISADFYTIKGLLQSVMKELGFDEKRITFKMNQDDIQHFHPYQSATVYLGKELLGIIGRIHPLMAKDFNVSNDVVIAELTLDVILKNKAAKVKFKPISKYPSITRDLAFVVDGSIPAQKILSSIEKHGKLDKENIITDIEVFDVYTGEHVEQGQKSIALSITFQSNDRTLKDNEINEVYQAILQALESDVQAKLRG